MPDTVPEYAQSLTAKLFVLSGTSEDADEKSMLEWQMLLFPSLGDLHEFQKDFLYSEILTLKPMIIY